MNPQRLSIALLAYFLCVLAVSWLRPIEVGNRWVQLFRMLLPSWRFFEEVGEVPTLRYRWGASEDTLGLWRPALAPLPRRLRRLFFNADGNLALAHESLLRQLVDEIAELDDVTAAAVERLVSYRLTRNFVEQRVRDMGGYFYEFKLSLASVDDESAEDVVVSAVHRC